MSALSVHSEIGRLRRVLVHEPGAEIDRMVPDMMEELLFDDILFGGKAREEHRLLRRLLEHLGVATSDMFELLTEALAEDEARAWIRRAIAPSVSEHVARRLEEFDAEALARAFVEGIRRGEDGEELLGDELFEILPIPNWCFQRDPQVVLGDGVALSAMATATRSRESLLSSTVFRFHPEFRGCRVWLDPMAAQDDRPLYWGLHRPCFEGGDVMILREDVVMVGYSERTSRSGIRQLASALQRQEGGPRYLLVAALPHKRAYMHLDTVITQIDHDLCLAYPQVVLGGHDDTASVWEFDLQATDARPAAQGDLLAALRAHGLDLEAIPCGGDDVIDQQREQWTDGANALAIAPGICLLYDRNVRTAEALDRRGFDVIEAAELLDGRRFLDPDRPQRTCILLPSTELSRARGGPHCLTHALQRDRLG
jgi:arginine deiminase